MTTNNDDLFRTMMDVMKQMQRYGFAKRRDEHGHHHGFGRGRLLKLIADHENVTQSELAELLDIRPSSLSEMLSKLANRGLIERQVDDDDKRITHVILTEAGAAIIKEREAAADAYLTDLFEGLDDDEITQLQTLLAKLDDSIKDKLSNFDEAPDFPPFGGPHRHGGHANFDGPRRHHMGERPRFFGSWQ
ncbi:MarR family winged helix-turn-helix transcriptional regulator [Furfurilactobacillus curtus]|uniref:MarR family transcriptional regulator n=1 Tax=Furfurilactobacillus curtus TaxID=1746200 RepID=A0ABQ5JQ87_9LACO